MMLTRAAFAVMIKFSGLVEVFEKIHCELDYNSLANDMPKEEGIDHD